MYNHQTIGQGEEENEKLGLGRVPRKALYILSDILVRHIEVLRVL